MISPAAQDSVLRYQTFNHEILNFPSAVPAKEETEKFAGRDPCNRRVIPEKNQPVILAGPFFAYGLNSSTNYHYRVRGQSDTGRHGLIPDETLSGAGMRAFQPSMPMKPLPDFKE